MRHQQRVGTMFQKERLAARVLIPLSVIAAGSLIFSACNIGCFFLPCDREIDVTARVTDSSGAPLQGVKVDVQGYKGETDGNGCVKLNGVTTADQIWLKAERPGYAIYDEGKPWAIYEIEVTLERAGSAHHSNAKWHSGSSRLNQTQCVNSGGPD